jgi:hypothetical protein
MSIVTYTPAIIALTGTTKAERQQSALPMMTRAALTATAISGGKLGKAAAQKLGDSTAADFASECAWPHNNYRGLAAYIAGQLGEDIVVGSRATYLSLVDQMDQRMMKVKSSKSGGYKTDSNGLQVPNAALAKLMMLRSLIVDVQAHERELSQERIAADKARRAAEAEQMKLEQASA